jgi:hypothetical protein
MAVRFRLVICWGWSCCAPHVNTKCSADCQAAVSHRAESQRVMLQGSLCVGVLSPFSTSTCSKKASGLSCAPGAWGDWPGSHSGAPTLGLQARHVAACQVPTTVFQCEHADVPIEGRTKGKHNGVLRWVREISSCMQEHRVSGGTS